MRHRLKKSASVCRGLLVAGCNIEPVSKPNQDTQPGPNVFFLLRTTCQNNTEHLYLYIYFIFFFYQVIRYSKHINISIVSSYSWSLRNGILSCASCWGCAGIPKGNGSSHQQKTGKVQGQIWLILVATFGRPALESLESKELSPFYAQL